MSSRSCRGRDDRSQTEGRGRGPDTSGGIRNRTLTCRTGPRVGRVPGTRSWGVGVAPRRPLQHFANISGKRNVIYMTGQDLALIFGGHIGLIDALLKKIDA